MPCACALAHVWMPRLHPGHACICFIFPFRLHAVIVKVNSVMWLVRSLLKFSLPPSLSSTCIKKLSTQTDVLSSQTRRYPTRPLACSPPQPRLDWHQQDDGPGGLLIVPSSVPPSNAAHCSRLHPRVPVDTRSSLAHTATHTRLRLAWPSPAISLHQISCSTESHFASVRRA